MEIITLQTVQMQCGECGVLFWVTEQFDQERRERNISWYCPNGHSRVYAETDTDKLKRELNEANKKLAHAQFELLAAEKKVKRIEKRVANGVCPCCNRQFAQLARHMRTKHPEFVKGNK